MVLSHYTLKNEVSKHMKCVQEMHKVMVNTLGYKWIQGGYTR